VHHLNEGLVLRLLDGGLPPDLAGEIHGHLDDCLDCLDLVARTAEDEQRERAPDRAEAPERIGRFQLKEALGFGGMGVVRVGECPETGERVAIKRVLEVDQSMVLALRREIHALGELDHPGIVRIREDGVAEDGSPWYAMELIPGDTLKSRIERLPPNRADIGFSGLRPILGIVRDLCETLAFLHSRELVHRDLTPANIVLRHDDFPVLVDFGLSHRRVAPGRESIDSWAHASGTRPFAAPEQWRGDLVDARADLYALGCILYQITTGRLPERRRFARHRTGQAARNIEAPSATLPDLPSALDAVILRLLAVDPSDRIGYAQDVSRALESAGVRDSLIQNNQPPRSYVYRPRLVGRASEVAALEALVQRCAKGQGARAFLAGESGIGKTRVAMEIAARARRHHLAIVTSSCAPLEMRSAGGFAADVPPLQPFRALLTALGDRARQGGAAIADRLFGARAKILAAHEPTLAKLPGQEKYPDPAAVDADVARVRLLMALEQTLAAAAQDHFMLLIIDDWQWADTLSIAFLDSLPPRFFERCGVLILGTYRTDEIDPAISARLEAMSDEHRVLTPLPAGELKVMASDMLAYPDVPESLVALLAQEADGNPFFLTEYVRLAVDEGWLTRDTDGAWKLVDHRAVRRASVSGLRVPQPLQALSDRRLAGLSAPAQTLSGFASVLGRSFPIELLNACPGVASTEIPHAIDELFTRQIIEDQGGADFRFKHDQLRHAAYRAIPAADMKSYHRAAAVALEAVAEREASYPVDARRSEGEPAAAGPLGRAAALAHHWGIAGETVIERRYRRVAGTQAFAHGAYRDAVVHLARCRQLPAEVPDPTADLALERELAEAHFGLGDIAASRAGLESVVAKAGFPMPKGNSAVARAAVEDVVSYARGTILALRGRAPTASRSLLLIQAARGHERLAHVLFFENETVGVAASSLRALAAAAGIGDSPELSRAYANLSLALGLVGAGPIARMLQWRAHAVAAQVQDLAAAAWAHEMQGVYEAGIGKWHAAEHAFTEAGEVWRRQGDRRRWEECLTLLGMTRFHAGETARAAIMRNELLALSDAAGSEQTRGWALLGQAEDRLLVGNCQGALEALKQAETLGPAIRRVERFWMLGLRSRAHLLVGESTEAARHLDAALEILEGVLPVAFYALEGYSGIAETALALASTGDDGHLSKAELAVSKLSRFAFSFPIAVPRARLWRGELCRLSGNSRAAARHFEVGRRRAQDLGRSGDADRLGARLAAVANA